MANTTHAFTKDISRQVFQPPFRVAADQYSWPWERLTSVKTSSAATESTFSFNGLGYARPTGELEPFWYADLSENASTTWTHAKYTLGTMFSQELLEDSQYISHIKEAGEAIGQGQAYIVEYTVATVLNRAFNASYTLWDSAALCATHTMFDGSSWSNSLTAASLYFDTLWSAISHYETTLTTQDGLPITDKPKFLIYHPSQEKNVVKLLKSTAGEPDSGGDNNVNSLLLYGLVPISCRHLTSTYWFVAGTKFQKDFVFYWRIRKEVKQEGDFDRDAIKIRSRQRYSVGLRDFTYIVGNAGT